MCKKVKPPCCWGYYLRLLQFDRDVDHGEPPPAVRISKASMDLQDMLNLGFYHFLAQSGKTCRCLLWNTVEVQGVLV